MKILAMTFQRQKSSLSNENLSEGRDEKAAGKPPRTQINMERKENDRNPNPLERNRTDPLSFGE